MGIGRIREATQAAVEALFHSGPGTAELRILAPHLRSARERTVLENHLLRWLYPYWELPTRRALLETMRTIGDEPRPGPGERWRQKLSRTARALRHQLNSSSPHG